MSSGRRHLLSPLEAFSAAPLLAILPRFEGTQKLEQFAPSLFARYEQVMASKSDADDESSRGLALEAAMLRQVLEWLDMKPSE